MTKISRRLKKKLIRFFILTMFIVLATTIYIQWLKITELNIKINTEIENNTTLKKTVSVLKKEKNKLEKNAIYPKESDDIYKYIIKNYRQTPPTIARKIANYIVEISAIHKLDPILLVAIIETESSFNPYKVSNKLARGLMQVRYETWKEKFGLNSQFDLHKIRFGIKIGTLIYLDYLTQTGGDRKEALYLYVGKDKNYVKDVLINMGKIKLFLKYN